MKVNKTISLVDFEFHDTKTVLFAFKLRFCVWYVLVSLMAQTVKNPPAMWETWAQSLRWEDPLEKGKATHSSILAWRIQLTV